MIDLDLSRCDVDELHELELEAAAVAGVYDVPPAPPIAGFFRALVAGVEAECERRLRQDPPGRTPIRWTFDPDLAPDARAEAKRHLTHQVVAARDRQSTADAIRDVWADVVAALYLDRVTRQDELGALERLADDVPALEEGDDEWTA